MSGEFSKNDEVTDPTCFQDYFLVVDAEVKRERTCLNALAISWAHTLSRSAMLEVRWLPREVRAAYLNSRAAWGQPPKVSLWVARYWGVIRIISGRIRKRGLALGPRESS